MAQDKRKKNQTGVGQFVSDEFAASEGFFGGTGAILRGTTLGATALAAQGAKNFVAAPVANMYYGATGNPKRVEATPFGSNDFLQPVQGQQPQPQQQQQQPQGDANRFLPNPVYPDDQQRFAAGSGQDVPVLPVNDPSSFQKVDRLNPRGYQDFGTGGDVGDFGGQGRRVSEEEQLNAVTQRPDGIYSYTPQGDNVERFGTRIFSDTQGGATPRGLNADIAKYGQTGFTPGYDQAAEAATVKARRDATSAFLAQNQQSLDKRAANRKQRRLERMANAPVDLNQGLSEFFTNVSQRRYARNVLKDQRANKAASELQNQKDKAAMDREGYKQKNENARTSATNRTKLSVEGAKRYGDFIDSTVEALGGADKGYSRAQVESTMNLAVNAYDDYMKKADPKNYRPLGGDPATWEGFDRSVLGVVSEALLKGAKPEQVQDLIRQTVASYGTGKQRS